MKRYIDKDALVTEIRKRLLPVIRDKHYDEWEEGQDSERITILDIINTLEVKEVDLKKEIYDAEKRFGDIDEMGGYRILIFDDDFRDILHYFFELGLKAQKGE